MKPELLLPVGNLKMALAAIHNGADAIYLGMPGFNARGRSQDHSLSELKEMIEMCHLYDVKVHLAFNILIFQNELEKAGKILAEVLALGPDALIVQDIGLVRLIKQMAPNQVIHASTQMTVTNHEAIELLEDLKINRFVLGRENSLAEIAKIRDKTEKELEVFVHGALCVAYSGQCFTSEALGGRSANRGQCAQSCRFDYELYVDGEKKDLIDKKYLVSPRDLCGIKEVSELAALGVESFKVEGRLKGPEYVASVAKNYRNAIDQEALFDPRQAIEEMELIYSRGFYSGWLHGVAHQELVDGTFSNKRGRFIGKVLKKDQKWVYIDSDTKILPGDGIFFADHKQQTGGSVYQVDNNRVAFARNFDLSQVDKGQNVYLSARESVKKQLLKSTTDKSLFKRLPLFISVYGQKDQVLEIHARVGASEIKVTSQMNLQAATSRPLTNFALKEMLQGLSHTPYELVEFDFQLGENLFLHQKDIKRLKQTMVAQLNQIRIKRSSPLSHPYTMPQSKNISQVNPAKLTILLRTLKQVESTVKLLAQKPHLKPLVEKIIIDFEFGKDFSPAVQLIKEHRIQSVIATTRILKPNEYHNFRMIERATPDGILIRNLGALHYFKDSAFFLYGDFSLNVTNHLSFDYFLSKGLSSICASYDMNTKQLDALIPYIDSSKLEITIHQYMPEFHMEHCVFAAFLSQGNSFKDCGKPCEKHRVTLKDMYGNIHEIKADQECRNTMFKASAQSTINLIPDWIKQGISSFRLEALHETTQELDQKLEIYLALLNQQIPSKNALDKLNIIEQYGVSTGQMLNTRPYLDRKK